MRLKGTTTCHSVGTLNGVEIRYFRKVSAKNRTQGLLKFIPASIVAEETKNVLIDSDYQDYKGLYEQWNKPTDFRKVTKQFQSLGYSNRMARKKAKRLLELKFFF